MRIKHSEDYTNCRLVLRTVDGVSDARCVGQIRLEANAFCVPAGDRYCVAALFCTHLGMYIFMGQPCHKDHLQPPGPLDFL
jgi:hypothetical protein